MIKDDDGNDMWLGGWQSGSKDLCLAKGHSWWHGRSYRKGRFNTEEKCTTGECSRDPWFYNTEEKCLGMSSCNKQCDGECPPSPEFVLVSQIVRINTCVHCARLRHTLAQPPPEGLLRYVQGCDEQM
jgi:hypothetical protein